MQIWVDADACPKSIKQIIFKAAMRCQILVTFVANNLLDVPISTFVKRVKVAPGFDVADNYIVEHCQARDLVITADIPLADHVVNKGCIALNPRGELYLAENIKQLLSIRNFHDSLRTSGMITGGPAKLHPRDIQAFANCLDRQLARMQRN